MQIFIDTYRCNGCMTCVELCPHIFHISELSGKADLLDPLQTVTDEILKAAAFCPQKCIEVGE
ncbi:MAG: ferredoxin [Desulfobulbus propionicus]|nr:MAG: ferredoxin [Desulfobulbus propionicus]